MCDDYIVFEAQLSSKKPWQCPARQGLKEGTVQSQAPDTVRAFKVLFSLSNDFEDFRVFSRNFT